MEWSSFHYYKLYNSCFSHEQCDEIVGMYKESGGKNSVLYDHDGEEGRNAKIFWLYNELQTSWIFSKLESIVREYDTNLWFDLLYPVGAAQLSRYNRGQHYNWHMDLGGKKASNRKVSIVVELSRSLDCAGGGIEIFHR